MNESRLVRAVTLVGLALLLGTAARTPLYSAVDLIADLRGPSPGLSAAVSTVVEVLPPCAVVLTLVALPWLVARQEAEVDEHGITVARRPMLWCRGGTASIPWRDVYFIKKTSSSRNKLMLEVQLSRVDHEPRMPGWARLVLAGETKLGSTSPRARVLFRGRHNKVQDLERMLRNARPDLFEAPPVAAGTPAAQGTAESQWVDLRRSQILGWGVLLIVNVSLCGFTAVKFSMLMLLMTVAVLALTVYAAPLMFTHQGVSVDSTGITLVREPARWFADATLHIPWSEVRTISEGVVVRRSGGDNPSRSASSTVELMLRSPDWVSQTVPHWASVVGQETQRSPASPEEPLTRITIKPVGNRAQRQIVEALHAVRPDLAPVR